MKKLCACLISLFGLMPVIYGQTKPSAPIRKDSVVVIFGNKTRMILVTDEKDGIKNLQKYDFNEILKDVGIFSENAKNKETYLYINDATGRRYLKDTTVVVTERDEPETEAQQDTTDQNNGEDSEEDDHKWWSHERTEFAFDFGFNTYLESGKVPARYDSPYGLRPLGARYVAFSVLENQRIGGEKSPFYIRWGLELAWNNFMFQGNNFVQQTPNGLAFPDYVNEAGQSVNLDKSKLTVCYLSLPIMPTLQFHNKSGRRTFKIAAGGYAGLRLGSYTKIKYTENDNTVKKHARGNYYLNDFRYGLMAQVGIRGLSLFAKYDLNPLFSKAKGPDLRVLSFGITFFNF